MLRYWMTISLLFTSALLHAQEESAQFYLLRTGYLLEGSATFDGKHYTVQTPFGSMNVPVQNVELVGKSKGDIYQYKRSNVDPANCNALIRFAEWCVSNGFTEEGIAEYQRAGQIASNTAFAGLIRQRLDTLQQNEPSNTVPETPITPAEIAVSRQMFESFVRRVQPVLVNRCISTDCHGTTGNQQFKMGIPREPLGSTSQRNLQAVLAYIDLDAPTESPLLLALITPHGGTKTVLSTESGSYIQSAQWIQQVAKELLVEERPDKMPKMETDGTTMRVATLPEPFRHVISTAERPNIQEQATSAEFDPLDPRVFNDKYHREQKQRGLFR